MEDDFSILVDKGAGAEGEIPALFGVFDGHGGSRYYRIDRDEESQVEATDTFL